MASLKPVQSVLAFLTIIPVGKKDGDHDIHYIAKNMYLFPVAGAIVGIMAGGMAFGISPFLPPLLVGLLVAGALVILTGVHHTDALADFADGMMAKGDKEKKRKAMMDPAVGSAGVAALVMYFAGMIIVFNTGFSGGIKILTSIIAAEVIAKYIMVLLTYRGTSAWEGFSSPFTAAMKDGKKMLAATAIMLPIVWFSTGYAGMAALGVSVALGALVRHAAKRSFGGISGDVLGASNEVARLASLIVLSSLPPVVMTL
ncbi:cobalamin-5'-phosphate synthase [Candidatus Nitrososphaera evergladensis SR1]|uniref:Adenosylcobinamide-GDP ribazoletransferase n=1 Tax=Candidatus Nitrososphaera evergladensis SR1 TaxID=1459636 RepID=A0A075MU07_9ARCH|nr:adenosylcobinamide-GDP ribazoletransferase [Candidatus Nitrososphaera evergladensis]AIF85151.1 cobalamin-5'-phosphate synthase [Candidatus Nitrososphaera evergladensis SR1]